MVAEETMFRQGIIEDLSLIIDPSKRRAWACDYPIVGDVKQEIICDWVNYYMDAVLDMPSFAKEFSAQELQAIRQTTHWLCGKSENEESGNSKGLA